MSDTEDIHRNSGRRIMAEGSENFVNAIKNSQLLRILLIGFLVLLLQIPIAMIDSRIRERKTTRQEAVEEVTEKWGRAQTLLGPIVAVPYRTRWEEKTEQGIQTRTDIRHATFLAEKLDVSGKVESETRHRGIYEIPVYRMSLRLTGSFLRPDFSDWGIEAEDVLWDRAQLWIQVSDAHAIQSQAMLSWDGDEVPFLPGAGDFAENRSGIHVFLKGRLEGDRHEFSFPLVVNGSVGAYFAPLGRETRVSLESNWSDPSFQGSWLPSTRKVTDSGFDATWNIPSLGRNFPQRWVNPSDVWDSVEGSRFGVDLVTPIDPYRMSERSIKYEVMFLFLTFLSLWLFEILVRCRIHSVQYLLMGAGICLFYLLELSLSEHIGFLTAYLLASVGVVSLLTAYSVAILKKGQGVAMVAILISALYAYLYILLTNQDYALLIGSIGSFVILAAVMYLTRKIDWHQWKA